ncbi:MAG: cbb3-type cytochrome oxidase assembly protein CcoS [Campylobacteraceae bacterium]|jgi:cbb3-type cytochrome oxidase maturation protein|nr:cbb3-type cytochrome oxidase assembly protein CcoS [Campylobacteraceae bacterium]
MDTVILAMMIGVSLFLGAFFVLAFIWALKTGQLEDRSKFLDAVHTDGVDELNEAAMLEKRKKEAIERKNKSSYRPPD